MWLAACPEWHTHSTPPRPNLSCRARNPPAAGSPLQPFWLNESDSLLFYRLTKSACIFGLARGEGFLISRWAACLRVQAVQAVPAWHGWGCQAAVLPLDLHP